MSINISKKKRDDLLDKIKQIRAFIAAAPQDENTGNLLSYLSDLEKDVNGKKYGLVFEEHREEIDEVLDTHTPVLTEDADLFVDHGGQMNFLLEGDNLAALKLLEKTHRGKIDLIYIDPPYNLGEDFIYSDHYVGREDSFKHSKWLSFMSSRLRIAYRLLASKGAIFISINDAEYAGLKMLCDSMWGDENYQATLIWKSRQRADSRNISMLSTDHEYILVYGKSSSFRLLGKDKDKTKYRNPDNDPRGPWASIDLSGLADASRRPNLHFDIIDPKTGNVYPPNPNRGWSKSKETIEKMIAENRILWPSSPKGRPREKKFLSSLLSDKTGFSSVLDPEEVGYTTDGTRAYAFWYCLLNNTEQLCEFISTVPLTVEEWDLQHNVYINQGNHTRLELAQATLFLNRTNVSGVITGGMIGKRDQSGNYKLDARFNRVELIRKIRTIAALSDRIDLYNLDAMDFLQHELHHYYKAFINFDPPYVIKGGKLYKNAFTTDDHRVLRDCIARCHRKWIVTYDVCDLVSELYANFRRSTLDIYYSANNVRTAKEYIFFSDNLVLPDGINLAGD